LCAGSLSPIATETRTRPVTFTSSPDATPLCLPLRLVPLSVAARPPRVVSYTGSFFAGAFDALPDPHPGALLASSSSFSRYSVSVLLLSLLSTGYLWSCTFRLSVLYLRDLCSAGGFGLLMTPGCSRCVFRASAGLNRAFPSLVLFGGTSHSSLHAPLPVPVLATRDLERPRPSSRSNCMVCRAGLASRAPLLAVRLAGLFPLACIHSAVWLHREL